MSPLLLSVLLFQACSINLTNLDKASTEVSDTEPIFKEINLYYAGQKFALPKEMRQAYSSAFDKSIYPVGKCYATANILTMVEKSKKSNSAWFIGTTLLPLWPAQPVNEDWTYRLEAKVFCDGTLIHNFEFSETAHIQAFWFGTLRSDLVNEASQEMHRKFMERLAFETSTTRQADLNSASDY